MVHRKPAGRLGFTLIELLVVIAIISIIAGFLVPTLLRGRGEAYKVQCANNLKQIFQPAMSYSDKVGNKAFPIGEGRSPPAHESVNKMLAFDSEGLKPQLFVCPEGEATAAQADENDKFVLDETSLAYSWVGKRTKNISNVALSSDKYFEGYDDGSTDPHAGHKQGMNVLMTDGSVGFKYEKELDAETGLPKGLVR